MVARGGGVRPLVGVGVFVTSQSHPGCVLLGKRSGTSAGSGSWALPGGHLEFGETWRLCAERELYEETGLRARQLRCTAVLNAVVPEDSYHYVVVLMSGVVTGQAASESLASRGPRTPLDDPRDACLPA